MRVSEDELTSIVECIHGSVAAKLPGYKDEVPLSRALSVNGLASLKDAVSNVFVLWFVCGHQSNFLCYYLKGKATLNNYIHIFNIKNQILDFITNVHFPSSLPSSLTWPQLYIFSSLICTSMGCSFLFKKTHDNKVCMEKK